MDPTKVKAVSDWPTPGNRKSLQSFIGFANFYRRFIRNFGQVAAPLTALTSTKKPFCWSLAAQAAFDELKRRFSSAPILITPDPSRQFIVEVDASEVGVGAVLSQRSPLDNKIHPCAYFSHRLSPTERNYDIGNRELLAVRLALGEWRHWLEGSAEPFLVWTDHRNLEYIQTAKRLNSRQARWALFFGRFNFTLSYRPGSKNIKPDALSRHCPGGCNSTRHHYFTWLCGGVRHLGHRGACQAGSVGGRGARGGPGGSAVCSGVGSARGSGVGSRLQTGLSPRSEENVGCHSSAFLVARHGGGGS